MKFNKETKKQSPTKKEQVPKPLPTMTYKEYRNTKEGELYEVLNGKVIRMMNSPSTLHQVVSSQLSAEFGIYLRGKTCKVYAAPIDVYLFENVSNKWVDEKVQNWVIPDLVVVSDPNKVKERGIIGAPELIIEIVSPLTAKLDYKTKYRAYEKAGVLEYWIVDPSNSKVDVYLLKSGMYQEVKRHFRGDSIKVSILDNLTINLTDIFPTLEDDE